MSASRLILIVEDSPQMATNLEIALASLGGAEVRVADSGDAALQLLEAPDCGSLAAVVTDLEMPVVDGYELIARLRANPRFASLPIIVSSGSVDPDAPGRAINAGANAYFAKPYSPAELRLKLETLLNERDHV